MSPYSVDVRPRMFHLAADTPSVTVRSAQVRIASVSVIAVFCFDARVLWSWTARRHRRDRMWIVPKVVPGSEATDMFFQRTLKAQR